jgi:hypothetical protein
MLGHTTNDTLVLYVRGCEDGLVNLPRQSKYLLKHFRAALETSSGKSDQNKGLNFERKKEDDDDDDDFSVQSIRQFKNKCLNYHTNSV